MLNSEMGYHGTTTTSAAALIQGGAGTFRLSANEYDWLGDGVYFWQDGVERAKIWARQRYKDQAAVLEATLLIEDCLDLLDVPAKQQLVVTYRLLRQRFKTQRRRLPRQTAKKHNLDREVIELHVYLMNTAGIRIRCVRSPFDEGLPIYPRSAFRSLSHVQIAVRDTSLITSLQDVML